MIRTAHILEEVESEFYAESEKYLTRLRTILTRMGYAVRMHGIEHCIPHVVEFYRTQGNKRYPSRAAFSDHVLERIRGHEGDIVLLTAPWHRECFKGLIVDGTWNGLPVIEMWQRRNSKTPEIIAHVMRKITELPTCQKQSASKTRNVRETILY